LLAKGYFPRELPPPFRSTSWAEFIAFNRDELPAATDPKLTKFTANVCTHSVPRLRGARRTLGIPNPISQLLLCEVLVDGADELRAHLHAGPRPYLSASRPMHWRTHARALIPRYKIGERAKLRLLTRRAAR